MSKNINKVEQFFSRSKYSKGTFASMFVILALALCLMILSSYKINISDSNNHSVAWNVANDISIIISSSLGVNLLLSFCLEKANHDKAFKEFFTEDIVSSAAFYDNLPEEEKIKMLHALEESHYGNNEWQKMMLESVRKKLIDSTTNYIIKKSKTNVCCSIHDTYIEKEISKTTIIELSENFTDFTNFKILEVASKNFGGLNSFEIKSIKINGKPINIESDVEIKTSSSNSLSVLDRKSDYNQRKQLYIKYIPSINKKIQIDLQYYTRVPSTDHTFVSRISAPCKNFSLRFNITGQEEYNIATCAFGFMDNAKESLLHNEKNNTEIEFSDWTFPEDGVAIFFNKSDSKNI